VTPARTPTGAPVALVTGAGRGIGRATAEALATAGYRLVLAELSTALGRRAERALARRGRAALFVETDVADPRSVRRLTAVVRRQVGHVDCLVNNAGVLEPGPLTRVSEADVQWMLDVNLAGPLLVTRAMLPLMRHGPRAVIVNVASLLGKFGMADYVTYCATKFGVVGLTEALADEVRDVRVWAVCPGQVDTPLAWRTGVSRAERRGLIRPEAVARVIVALATGQRREPSGSTVDVTR
jgi:3-oxoacyl-[acyl-carrier protein] reductase